MPTDHFPSTHATWIDAQLTIAESGERAAAAGDAGGRARAESARDALRRHLMERYRAALLAYARGGSLRRLGEADDLVDGYFADRACTAGFLLEWRTSGMPLRRWMMNGLNFYGRGIVRDRARARLRDGGPELAERAAGDLARALEAASVEDVDAAVAFERAWALSILNDAHARAHADLNERGRLDDYEIFRRRVIEGESYETIARSVGRSNQQCAGATRLVTHAMRIALMESLRAEGVPESELGAEASRVYELVNH